MDEEKTSGEEELKEVPLEKIERPPDRRSQLLRRIWAGVMTGLLVILALLVFVFRNELSEESLRHFFGRTKTEQARREAFTYETGARQTFATAGNGLAVASSSSVQLLDADGKTVFKQVISYDTPGAFGAAAGAMFCDLSGTGCLVVPFGAEEPISVTPAGTILTASMNENGWFCLVTSEPGYKGRVTVYNALGEEQYQWWSGGGYVLRAVVSPDNKRLAVLCAEAEGGRVHLFLLNSETEQASVPAPDTLLLDLRFMGSDTVCALGETDVRFLGTDGSERGRYDFGGRYLLDYDLSAGGFAALYLSEYRSGAGGELVTLDTRGGVIAGLTLERDLLSLSACGKQLLVMTGGDLTLYSQELVKQYSNETLMTARRAVLRPAGDALLLSAYAAERFRF